MAETAFKTCAQSNGQQELRTIKNKDMGFASREELAAFAKKLAIEQNLRCALTGLPMHIDGEDDGVELSPSVDRTDSDGHYEVGNLQVVCRFVNRWQGADNDREFRRPVELVRSGS